MKLNKNKVLAALSARETELQRAIPAAEIVDREITMKVLNGEGLKKINGRMDLLLRQIEEYELGMKEQRKELKQLQLAKSAILAKRYSDSLREYVPYNQKHRCFSAQDLKHTLQRVKDQKKLVKLVEGETVDSKIVDIDLTVL